MWKELWGTVIDFSTVLVYGKLKIENGGTGATTQEVARVNLNIYSKEEVDGLIGLVSDERSIWGYQDFAVSLINSTSVTLTANDNGSSAPFDTSKLINGTSCIFRQDSNSYAYNGSIKLFSSKVVVESQIADSITLSGIPNASWGTLRVWYQIKSTTIPLNYINPPMTVQTEVVAELGNLFEEEENKDTDGTLAANSDIKYPSQKATKTYADSKVADAINDGTTAIAPSQNAVFDSLTLKKSIAITKYAYWGLNSGDPTIAGNAFPTMSYLLSPNNTSSSIRLNNSPNNDHAILTATDNSSVGILSFGQLSVDKNSWRLKANVWQNGDADSLNFYFFASALPPYTNGSGSQTTALNQYEVQLNMYNNVIVIRYNGTVLKNFTNVNLNLGSLFVAFEIEFHNGNFRIYIGNQRGLIGDFTDSSFSSRALNSNTFFGVRAYSGGLTAYQGVQGINFTDY